MDTNVETTSEGVTGQQTDTPTSEGVTPTPEQSAGENQGTPENKAAKAQNRYQQLANENRAYKAKIAQFEEEMKSMTGPKQLHQALSSDPQKAALLAQIMDAARWNEVRSKIYGQPQEQQDPYAGFSPEAAQHFREKDELKQKLSELEKWKQDLIQKQEDDQKSETQKAYEANRTSIESEYESFLKKDGFLDKEGNPVDVDLVEGLNNATLSFLASVSQDPHMSTKEELQTAYAKALKFLGAAEKRGLKQVIKKPGVPASGTGNGKVASQKMDFSNPENRVAALVQGMKGH